jgi:hypothetical protein
MRAKKGLSDVLTTANGCAVTASGLSNDDGGGFVKQVTVSLVRIEDICKLY